MKNQKTVLFDNYHDEMRDYEEIRDLLLDTRDADEITDDMVYEEMAFQDDLFWQDIHEELRVFFNGKNWLAMGSVGRWDGQHAAGCVFDDFDDLFYKVTQDCDYWRIWDEDGHFYLKCSHHDGTNIFEVKRITQRARNYIDDWTSDKTNAEKHSVVFHCNFFSALPRFAQKVWNCGDTSEIGG